MNVEVVVKAGIGDAARRAWRQRTQERYELTGARIKVSEGTTIAIENLNWEELAQILYALNDAGANGEVEVFYRAANVDIETAKRILARYLNVRLDSGQGSRGSQSGQNQRRRTREGE